MPSGSHELTNSFLRKVLNKESAFELKEFKDFKVSKKFTQKYQKS